MSATALGVTVRGSDSVKSVKGRMDYDKAFPTLSLKLIQILSQGGDDFAIFFKPLTTYMTTKKEVYDLL